MDKEGRRAGFLVELLEYYHPDTDIHVRTSLEDEKVWISVKDQRIVSEVAFSIPIRQSGKNALAFFIRPW